MSFSINSELRVLHVRRLPTMLDVDQNPLHQLLIVDPDRIGVESQLLHFYTAKSKEQIASCSEHSFYLHPISPEPRIQYGCLCRHIENDAAVGQS